MADGRPAPFPNGWNICTATSREKLGALKLASSRNYQNGSGPYHGRHNAVVGRLRNICVASKRTELQGRNLIAAFSNGRSAARPDSRALALHTFPEGDACARLFTNSRACNPRLIAKAYNGTVPGALGAVCVRKKPSLSQPSGGFFVGRGRSNAAQKTDPAQAPGPVWWFPKKVGPSAF